MNRCICRAIVVFLCASCGGQVASARAEGPAAPEPRKVTSVEGITEYELGNGLRVLLFPDASKPTVTVNCTYFVGSRHEGYGETGMAHLLEHMLFKGTPSHPDIWKSLQEHGAQFNGSTWFDRTNYFETLAATDDNLEFALNMESDRMVHSKVANVDLQKEFTVVRNEFEMGENNPQAVLSERVRSTAYLWHNYGKSTIGSREDIERVPIDRLQAFYRKFYQPDNAMLIVAGKFDDKKTLAKVNALFGSIPRPSRVLDKTYTVEPAQDGEREVVLSRVGDVQALNVVYHVCAGAHPDMAPLAVLGDILDTDQTGRLYKALVETEMATSVHAEAQPLFDPGVMEIAIEVRLNKSLDEARKVALGVMDGLVKATFTDEEVERAKNAFARSFELLLNDSGRVGVELSEWAALGDWRLMFLHRDRMKSVTAADVQRVAASYFKPSNRTVGMFIPTGSPDRTRVPPTPEIASLLKGYRGSEEVESVETIEASPLALEARTQHSVLPVGMKVALLSKKTRKRRVNVQMTLHFGTEAELKGHITEMEVVPEMLMRGTAKHTRRQIKDQFDKLKARVRFGGGAPGVLSASIETSRKNLPEVLRLTAECLRESGFPEKEFEKLRKEQLSEIEQQLSEPQALAVTELRRRISPYAPDDVRYVPTLPEEIERLKAVRLEAVKKLYAEMLGASFSECAVVGDFDGSEVTNILTELFGNWKNPRPFERIQMSYKPVKPDSVVINTPDKANALFALGCTAELRDDDATYPAAFMANYVLGGNADSRLLNRIRQKEGLSYGCGSQLQAGSLDRMAVFIGFGICAPENTVKAIQCAQEEIDKLARDGVARKELDNARKGYREQLKVRLSQDGVVAGMLARQAYLGRTMKFEDEQIKKIEALTPQQVSEAARQYIQWSNLVVVRGGDFEKKAKEPAHKATKPEGSEKRKTTPEDKRK